MQCEMTFKVSVKILMNFCKMWFPMIAKFYRAFPNTSFFCSQTYFVTIRHYVILKEKKLIILEMLFLELWVYI